MGTDEQVFEYRAGLLAGDAIGKKLTVTYQHGAVSSTLTDVVTRIDHKTRTRESYLAKPEAIVEIWFQRTKWDVPKGMGLFNLPVRREVGLEISPDTIVKVHA